MATQEDKTNTGVVATIVVVGAFAMIGVSSMLAAMVREERAKVAETRPEHADLETIRALDQEQLTTLSQAAAWKDRGARSVMLPIERAEQLVLAQFKADPSSASPEPPPGFVMNPAGGAAPASPPAEGAAPAPGDAPTSPQAPATESPAPSAEGQGQTPGQAQPRAGSSEGTATPAKAGAGAAGGASDENPGEPSQ